MYLDYPESARHAIIELFYSAILLGRAHIMTCDTDWRSVDRNLAEAVVSDCAIFIVASCV